MGADGFITPETPTGDMPDPLPVIFVAMTTPRALTEELVLVCLISNPVTFDVVPSTKKALEVPDPVMWRVVVGLVEPIPTLPPSSTINWSLNSRKLPVEVISAGSI